MSNIKTFSAWNRFIKKQSLINKMRLLNFSGITAAMLIVLVLLSIMYFWFARQTLVNSVMADARLLATNTAPMLAFHDKRETLKLISTFKKTSNLQRVAIFNQKHFLFAEILSPATDYTPTPLQEIIPGIVTDTYHFHDNCLLVFVPIHIEEERMGTVALESSLQNIANEIAMFVTITSLATLLGIILSALILKRLHTWALAPILDMSKLAEQVAIDKSYHLRAKVDGQDEIASLALRFNQMLERIEMWDKDLNDEIKQRRKSERKLDSLARTDSLTQLPNRFALMGDMEMAVAHSLANNETLAVLFIDLDDFKDVNDFHGHHCGDLVLQVTAKRLLGILREVDTLYRLGGDEFAVLLKGVTEKEQAFLLIERLITKIGEKITITVKDNEITVQIGLSIGLAFCPTHATTYEELLRRADLAMYAAKRDGKNSFRQFETSMEK